MANQPIRTYRDPVLSMWQSAVAEVQRKRASAPAAAKLTAAQAATPFDPDALMAPADSIGESLLPGQPRSVATTGIARPQSLTAAAVTSALDVVGDCAKVAAEFLWAEITGNKQNSDLYAGELQKSECDALGWAECLTTYLAYKAAANALPYRPNQNVVQTLPSNATIAIIGDWGTGDDVAKNLLRQVATFNPDILLHLGDVYYSGTQSEAQNNFLTICRQILGANTPLYSLCGNHDMYSGGTGYYWLIDQIGQKSSYFCLQNDDWLFLAMDTGYNDNNPLTVATNMTALVNRTGWSEASWHINKIQQAGTRRIAAFSHHQLFSAFSSIGSLNGQAYAYNPHLFADFQAVIPKIDIWFWGHEHTLSLYDPYMGLTRGRCVGASAIPVFTNQQSYTTATGLATFQNLPMPGWNPSAILGNNGTEYNNAFAILTLKGPVATVNYYQVPLLQPFTPLPFTDTI